MVADSLAIVGVYGKPTYFITMTCNPEWNKIKSQLFSGQDASDRPNLSVRVFNAKLGQMLE